MKRVEVILSQALEEEYIQLCAEKNTVKKFTKIPTIMGAGNTNPKMGDAVWPQLNTLYLYYCSKEQAEVIKSVIEILWELHPNEGIACFTGNVESL